MNVYGNNVSTCHILDISACGDDVFALADDMSYPSGGYFFTDTLCRVYFHLDDSYLL